MNANPLLDTLRQQFTPATVQQMSTALGADPSTTNTAIALALPALLGGLSRNASKPEGAAALNQALDAHDGGILDNLGAILGGAGNGGGGGIGGAILGHIFGARRGPVEQGVQKASGLDPQQTARLLAMLAPIVMGVIGRMRQRNGIDATQLPDVLQKSATQIEKETPGAGGLAGMLDDVLGGLLKK